MWSYRKHNNISTRKREKLVSQRFEREQKTETNRNKQTR